MHEMGRRHFLPLWVLCFLLIIQLTPNPVRSWIFFEDTLVSLHYPLNARVISPPDSVDINGDGILETLLNSNESLTIIAGEQKLWQSPAGWSVIQSNFTDLDQDGSAEVTLLVWRPFQPWPVDEFLPYGGRIAAHQDGEGNSCHIILVGWRGDTFGELWAGSALVNPVITFRAEDLDGDSAQELITLEGEYSLSGSSPSRLINVWEWNGFGFTIVFSKEGSFSDLAIAKLENNQVLVLTP